MASRKKTTGLLYSVAEEPEEEQSEQNLKHDTSLIHASVTLETGYHHLTNPPSFLSHYYASDYYHSPTLDSYIDKFEIAKAKLNSITQQYMSLSSPFISSASSSTLSSFTLPDTITTEKDWQNQFLELMSTLIHCAEQLESISTELLNTERQVRELVLLQKSMLETYQEQENLYLSRIEECHQVSQYQTNLMEFLDELSHEIPVSRSSFDSSCTTLCSKRNRESCSTTGTTRVNEPSESTLEHIIHRVRCELSLMIGGSASTGRVMHSFIRKNATEWIVAGVGATASFDRCLYIIHIRSHDNKFRLLPKKEWVPDHQVDHCQSELCSTRFSLFQRRHHCRK
ncbi:uncharacterized protein B0P05DRAFT_522539 [Gilbertella persicaria]|uniref:uncharacterized protein n=1 Tax=Gilbertella persicaria TaxID=101096 RepID=UPI00221F2936|nr:uncharacterized protein B0P05DRAFT_522539 [Gilbertella persicaria]KAI8097901.1 hypothetical protein B0P05DRAFT_522539 [Gilbertella persicaria]